MKTKIQTILKKSAYWMGIVFFGTVLGLSLQFAKAWTEPSAAPPGGNVGAPINTSSTPQTKNGELSLNMGLFILDGNNAGSNRIVFRHTDASTYPLGGNQWEIYPARGADGYLSFYNRTKGGSALVLYNDGHLLAGGHIEAPDYYISNIGKWASEAFSGGGGINYGSCVTISHSQNGACGAAAWGECPANYVMTGVTTGLRYPDQCVAAQIKCCQLN